MNNYSQLEEKLGLKFEDCELLDRAFVHKSYVNEHRGEDIRHNERLEFLGDAVLELIATRHLFEHYPNQEEGEMTAYRSALVKGQNLAKVAEELELGQYLKLSKGEEKSGGREKSYILANTVEAVIGAIYLSLGYQAAEKMIEEFIMKELDDIIENGLHIDSKTKFQEICQEKEDITPHYDLIEAEGPDHEKIFTMGAYIGEELISQGTGSSKQKAEDAAAAEALRIKGWE